MTRITLACGRLAMVAIQPAANMPVPPPANGAGAAPDFDALLAEGEAPLMPQVPADERLDQELASRFKAAQDARRDTEKEMFNSLRRRHGEYPPEVYEKLVAAKASRSFSNITEGKCAAAEAQFVNLILFSPSRAWGIEASPIPELEGPAMENVQHEAGVLTGALEGADFEAAVEEIAAQVKESAQAEADRRAERMQKLIDDQFAEGGWRKSARAVIHDFCTLEIAGWMGPILVESKERRVVGNAVVYETKVQPTMVRLDPFGIYPGAGAADVADGDLFYRTLITDDQAVELVASGNLLSGRGQLAYSRKGALLGDGDVDQQVFQELKRQQDPLGTAVNPDGRHELIYWWHRMTRQEAAGVRREEVPPDQAPDERLSYMGLILNGVVISCVENWDPSGKPQVHVCSYRSEPDSVFGHSLPWLNKDPQNERNVAIRSLHTNMQFSSRPMLDVALSRLVNPWDTTTVYPGKVFATQPDSSGENRPAVTPLAIPNFTPQMLGAANQAVEWAHDATGIFPQAYGAARQIGPAETMGGYQMLREDQMTTLKLAISSLDEAIQSLVDSFWLWNMLTPGHDECKGDSKVVSRGIVQLFLSSENINNLQAKIQFFLQSPDAAAQLKANGLLKLMRAWFVLSNLDPDEYLVTEEEADRQRAEAEQVPPPEETPPESGEPPPQEPQPKPESESDRIRAEADMIRAQAAQKKADTEAGKLAIQRADATIRAMKARREEQQARAAMSGAAMPAEAAGTTEGVRGAQGVTA